MINSSYYTSSNAVIHSDVNKIKRFEVKPLDTVFSYRNHIVESGQDLYSLASTVFGKDSQYYWTIIAEDNLLRFPDDLIAGEVIRLPLLILEARIIKPTQTARNNEQTTRGTISL